MGRYFGKLIFYDHTPRFVIPARVQWESSQAHRAGLDADKVMVARKGERSAPRP
jgi:hypothetical protein